MARLVLDLMSGNELLPQQEPAVEHSCCKIAWERVGFKPQVNITAVRKLPSMKFDTIVYMLTTPIYDRESHHQYISLFDKIAIPNSARTAASVTNQYNLVLAHFPPSLVPLFQSRISMSPRWCPNRRSGVALAIRHRLWFKDREISSNAWGPVTPLPLPCMQVNHSMTMWLHDAVYLYLRVLNQTLAEGHTNLYNDGRFIRSQAVGQHFVGGCLWQYGVFDNADILDWQTTWSGRRRSVP